MQFLRQFIELFEGNLHEALMEKTSWGRNDLKLLIKSVLTDTLLQVIERNKQ